MKRQLIGNVHFAALICLCSFSLFSQELSTYKLPAVFIKNEGQWDSKIKFQSSSPDWGSNVYFLNNAVSFGFYKTEQDERTKNDLTHDHTTDVGKTMVCNMEFVGANKNVRTEGFDKQKSYSNYLKGNDFSKHKSFVPHYKGIQYAEIYSGIDVKYYQSEKGLEYDWIVSPNADINNIKLKCNGVKTLSINKQKQLVITTAWGDLIESLPESYQIIDGQKKQVQVDYLILSDNTFGYKITGNYNPNHSLIVDPITLSWSTYLGTGTYTYGHDVEFDAMGNVYVEGCTKGNFPTTAGVYDQSFNGGETDFVVVKFDPSGTNLIYATVVGTDSMDHSFGHTLSVLPTGEVVVGGHTSSANFPLVNPVDNVFGNMYNQQNFAEGVLFKLNANGTSLLFSTFLGGSQSSEYVSATYVDNANNIYFAESTPSNDFPVTAGAYDITFNNANDIVFGKIDAAFSLSFCSYLGGSNVEFGSSIRTDFAGNIYIAGTTSSTNFPITAGTAEPTNAGTANPSFLIKINPVGNAIIQSTYFGAYLPVYGGYYPGQARIEDFRINALNEVYFVGTASGGLNTTAGAFQPTYTGYAYAAMVGKINSQFSAILNLTYLAGTQGSNALDMELDGNENVYVSGNTSSTNFPITACAHTSIFSSVYIFFFSRLDKTLNNLQYSTFFGPTAVSGAHMALYDPCGAAKFALCGFTSSSVFPVTANAYQPNKLTTNGSMVVSLFEVSRPTADFTFSANTCAVNFTDASNGNCIWEQNWTPDAWRWDFGDGNTATTQNPSHTYAGNGTYNVKLIVNCPADTVEKTVTISSCSVLCTASAGASVITNANCNGATGSATVNLSNGSGGTYTYSWSNGASTITTATSNTEQLTSNTYTVTITDGGCSTTSTIQITQPAAITPGTITPTSASCGQTNGSAVTAVATGGTGTLSYSWSNSATGLTANTLTAATYTLTITDANLCTATTTTTINNIGGASISSVVPTNALCNGGTGSVTVNISGGVSGNYTYSWSNGANTITTATSNQEQLTSNTYTVTVTDGSCSVTSTFSITQPNAIALGNPVVTDASCNQSNGSISITLSGGTTPYTYSWSNGASSTTTSTTSPISNLTAQTYTLTVTDGNNCTQTTSVTINNSPAPVINAVTTPTLICNGNKGAVTITASGTGTLTYSWSSTAATNTTGIFNGITAGNYTVTVIDANGCLQTSTVLIIQPDAIGITAPVATNTNCNQSVGTITFATPTGGTGSYTYSWSNGATTQNISLLAATGYTVTVKDNNGCSITTSATVNNNNGTSILSATATDPLCNGNTGSATVTISASTAPYTYSWSNGASTVTTATSNQELLTSNSYTLTITDGNNCSTTTTIVITEPLAIALSNPITTAAHCGQSDGTAQLTISGGTGLYTYSWSNGNTGITSNTQLNNSTLAAGIFTLQVSDVNNCSTTFSSVIASNNTPPAAAASATIYSIAEGETTILSAGGGISYTWTPNSSLTCATCPITIANPTATTTYTLIVKDNLGCADTTNITINVKKPCTGEEDVFIANLFSPNNDGKNDVLLIQGNGLTNIYFTIYDRWGNKLFETRDQAQGWDGSVNGNTVNAGTYVYFLKGTCKKTNTEVILKGNVSVLR